MNRLMVGGLAAVACVVVSAVPAGADPWSGGGDIADGDVIANARSDMAELNSGYGGNTPPNCNDEHDLAPEDGNDEVEHQGWLRWIPAFEEDPTPSPDTRWYEQICWFPEREGRDGAQPGGSWQRFDVGDEILAQVAVDNALASIPTQTIRTSPDTDAMVGVPTWFWIEGVPAEGVSATASVPGATVVATAHPGGVQYDFGDGTTAECEGAGTPYAPGATPDCTHEYERAGNHTITATILWTGEYTVNGAAPVPMETSVAVTATRTLLVNEAQAINNRDGG